MLEEERKAHRKLKSQVDGPQNNRCVVLFSEHVHGRVLRRDRHAAMPREEPETVQVCGEVRRYFYEFMSSVKSHRTQCGELG